MESKMNRLSELLTGLTIGEPQTHLNMQVFPLHVQNGHERAYRTLDEAISDDSIKVSEITEGGSVPQLIVQNTGNKPVLMVTGEELVGAKQNRVLNTSLLVPAKSETAIPVSCVEQGRWAYTSRRFESGATTSHFKLRKTQTQNVTSSLRASESFDANQREVWGEVSRKMSSHAAFSSTGALHEMYEQTQHQIKEYLDTFSPPEGAEGVLVLINGQIAGADLFDHHETLKTLWEKLLKSYAVDALERQKEPVPVPEPPPDNTQQFLTSAQDASEEEYDSAGLGKDVRFSSDTVTGSCLLWEDRAIHTSLFSAKT
jgi:hypothetical protein